MPLYRSEQRAGQRDSGGGHAAGGKAPRQDQPDRPGQRPEHHEVPDGKARRGDPEAQQPLRRRLRGDFGRGVPAGEPRGPDRGLRRMPGPQPPHGPGNGGVGGRELPRGRRRPGLRGRDTGDSQAAGQPADHPVVEDRPPDGFPDEALRGHQVPDRRRHHRSAVSPQQDQGTG